MRIERRYAVLGMLSVLAGLIAFFGRGIWVVDAFASNVAAGFIGSLVTVALIDRATEERREAERSRIERIALRQAKLPLTHLVNLCSDMIKAASKMRPAVAPASLDVLFAEDLASALNWLDLTGNAGLVNDEATWLNRMDSEIRVSCDRLSIIVDKYVAFLPVDTVDAIEDLAGDEFLLFMRNMLRSDAELKKAGVSRKYSIDLLATVRRASLDKLLRVVRIYERSTGDIIVVPKSFMRDDESPALGTSRFKELLRENQIGWGGPPPARVATPTASDER